MIDVENMTHSAPGSGVVFTADSPGHRSPCQFGRLPPRSSPSAEPISMGKFRSLGESLETPTDRWETQNTGKFQRAIPREGSGEKEGNARKPRENDAFPSTSWGVRWLKTCWSPSTYKMHKYIEVEDSHGFRPTTPTIHCSIWDPQTKTESVSP